MPGPADSGAAAWLVLVYRLPPKPPSLRSLVHRKLTAVGAVYLTPACATALAGPAERVMRRMRATIADAGGSAVLRARALSGGPEIAAAFNAARDREYETIITSCRDAAAAIETMLAAGEFRSGQLPDSDATLKRLDRATAPPRGTTCSARQRPQRPRRPWTGTGRCSISTPGASTPETAPRDVSAACFTRRPARGTARAGPSCSCLALDLKPLLCLAVHHGPGSAAPGKGMDHGPVYRRRSPAGTGASWPRFGPARVQRQCIT